MKRTAIAVAVAALLSNAAHAAVTEFVIYKDNDFKGAQHVVKGEVAHLEEGFARQGASLVVRGGFWEACSRSHFKGDCRVFAEGDYPKLGADWSKRIVSLRFLGTDPKYAMRPAAAPREATREEVRDAATAYGAIDLYAGADFRGRSVRVHDNVRDLGERNFEGRAASAIVHAGTWIACSDPGFLGRCTVLPPGPHAQLVDIDNRVASLRQLR